MAPWWRDAVFYQVYIRSFADGNGDGVGDLTGIRSRLWYLRWLGVDAIWITPFYPSPMADHGYDVADFRDVDPLFGTLDDFDALTAEAHAAGIHVVSDIVPNHTSDKHRWFQEAVADPDSLSRGLYMFRDPKPDGSPPNNWGSVFGGPAWTLEPGRGVRGGSRRSTSKDADMQTAADPPSGRGVRGGSRRSTEAGADIPTAADPPSGRQYYLHLFASEQPDLNWRDPRVGADFEGTLRFWFDRGVDGFRIDVAHGLFKDSELRDNPVMDDSGGLSAFYAQEQKHNFDQPEVHELYRSWRKLADAYPGDRVLIGEIFMFDPARVAPYVRPDELHLAFNFLLMGTGWGARAFREAIDYSMDALREVGACSTWALSNHDLVRHATRYGSPARARAAALVLLGLPGAAFVYQGEELGLEEADVPDDARQDPIFKRTAGAMKGRDGCRVPIPWSASPPRFGFSDADPWLPMPDGWGERSVESLRDDPSSILGLYRRAIAVRKELGPHGDHVWLDAPEGCLAFTHGRLVCACNFGVDTARLAVSGLLALGSEEGVELEDGKLVLPPDTSAWIATG